MTVRADQTPLSRWWVKFIRIQIETKRWNLSEFDVAWTTPPICSSASFSSSQCRFRVLPHSTREIKVDARQRSFTSRLWRSRRTAQHAQRRTCTSPFSLVHFASTAQRLIRSRRPFPPIRKKLYNPPLLPKLELSTLRNDPKLRKVDGMNKGWKLRLIDYEENCASWIIFASFPIGADRASSSMYRQKTENQLGESEQLAEKQTKLVEELTRKVRLQSKLLHDHELNSSSWG